MGELTKMPRIVIDPIKLKWWGDEWVGTYSTLDQKTKSVSSFNRKQSVNFAGFIDMAFGEALATFLGGIPVTKPTINSLNPNTSDEVEVGPVKVIGGIRPQNFDVAYRPDGPRVVFDSKSLNDASSIRKNWQNMINDLGTEATTVHTRYPYAIVSFLIILPDSALASKQEHDIIRTLERLGTRDKVIDQPHLAEAIALVIWDPIKGEISDRTPISGNLSLDHLSKKIEDCYITRYKGLPPHSS